MTTKSKRRVKVRTVKKRIINNKKIKGVKYTVEPLEAKTHLRTIDGDIFKKYIDGVLVKQVFVSKNKLSSLIRNLKKKFRMKAGGQVHERISQIPHDGKHQVEISDKTTFGQSVKSGFGAGLGVGFAFNIVELIFNSIFGDN